MGFFASTARIVFFTVLLFLFGSEVLIAGTPVTVSVRGDGEGVADLEIILRNLENGETYEATTGSNGRADFEDVEPGIYAVEFHIRGSHATFPFVVDYKKVLSEADYPVPSPIVFSYTYGDSLRQTWDPFVFDVAARAREAAEAEDAGLYDEAKEELERINQFHKRMERTLIRLSGEVEQTLLEAMPSNLQTALERALSEGDFEKLEKIKKDIDDTLNIAESSGAPLLENYENVQKYLEFVIELHRITRIHRGIAESAEEALEDLPPRPGSEPQESDGDIRFGRGLYPLESAIIQRILEFSPEHGGELFKNLYLAETFSERIQVYEDAKNEYLSNLLFLIHHDVMTFDEGREYYDIVTIKQGILIQAYLELALVVGTHGLSASAPEDVQELGVPQTETGKRESGLGGHAPADRQERSVAPTPEQRRELDTSQDIDDSEGRRAAQARAEDGELEGIYPVEDDVLDEIGKFAPDVAQRLREQLANFPFFSSRIQIVHDEWRKYARQVGENFKENPFLDQEQVNESKNRLKRLLDILYVPYGISSSRRVFKDIHPDQRRGAHELHGLTPAEKRAFEIPLTPEEREALEGDGEQSAETDRRTSQALPDDREGPAFAVAYSTYEQCVAKTIYFGETVYTGEPVPSYAFGQPSIAEEGEPVSPTNGVIPDCPSDSPSASTYSIDQSPHAPETSTEPEPNRPPHTEGDDDIQATDGRDVLTGGDGDDRYMFELNFEFPGLETLNDGDRITDYESGEAIIIVDEEGLNNFELFVEYDEEKNETRLRFDFIKTERADTVIVLEGDQRGEVKKKQNCCGGINTEIRIFKHGEAAESESERREARSNRDRRPGRRRRPAPRQPQAEPENGTPESLPEESTTDTAIPQAPPSFPIGQGGTRPRSAGPPPEPEPEPNRPPHTDREDTLIAGHGPDELTGGEGRDWYIFRVNKHWEPGNTLNDGDRITDYESGEPIVIEGEQNVDVSIEYDEEKDETRLGVDLDNDGEPDKTLTLEGDQRGRLEVNRNCCGVPTTDVLIHTEDRTAEEEAETPERMHAPEQPQAEPGNGTPERQAEPAPDRKPGRGAPESTQQSSAETLPEGLSLVEQPAAPAEAVPAPEPEAEEPPDLGLVKAEETVVILAIEGEETGQEVSEAFVKLVEEPPAIPPTDGPADPELISEENYVADMQGGSPNAAGEIALALTDEAGDAGNPQLIEVVNKKIPESKTDADEAVTEDALAPDLIAKKVGPVRQSFKDAEPSREEWVVTSKNGEWSGVVPAEAWAARKDVARIAAEGEDDVAFDGKRAPPAKSAFLEGKPVQAVRQHVLVGQNALGQVVMTDMAGKKAATGVPGLPASLLPAGAKACVARRFQIDQKTLYVVRVPRNVIDEIIASGGKSERYDLEPDPCTQKEALDDPHYGVSGLWGQEFDNQWAIKRVGFDEANSDLWPPDPAELEPVTVAVIDSGVDWYHPDLPREALWRNADEIPGNGIDDDGNGYVDDEIGWNFIDNDPMPWDHDGHGTFVAGLIAAGQNNATGISGINPAARVMVLKALDPFGRGHASHVAEAVAYAVDNGARVINLSLGSRGPTRFAQRAVDHARSKGVAVVVAAGNAGKDVSEYAPAGLEGVITVTATDRRDERAGFSNWGPLVDIAAPGIDVLSLRARKTDLLSLIPGVKYERGEGIVGEDRAYFRASGTSFAAPIVTGTLSLILSRNPELSAEQAERMVLHSARDIETPGFDNYTGYGLLDAAAALTASPDHFVETRITGVRVVKKNGKPHLRLLGTTDADRFAEAVVQLGKGATPEKWLEVDSKIAAPIRGATIMDLPARFFGGAKQWTIRLITRHKDGSSREARFSLRLG